MIRIKDHKQQKLFDPWDHLSPKRRRMLDKGLPGLFREHLLKELPARQMRSHFTVEFGTLSVGFHTVAGCTGNRMPLRVPAGECRVWSGPTGPPNSQ